MARFAGITTGILGAILVCALAGTGLAEIVKVTSSETSVYTGEKWVALPAAAEGKRFMVYGARPGLYFIQVSAKKQTYAWIRAQDVEVDWGKAKVKTTTVAAVQDVDTIQLADGTLVQLRRVDAPREDSPLMRQTLSWMKQVLVGKEVTLEFDTTAKNTLGYAEAYVYVGGMFLNRLLVERGLATLAAEFGSKGRYDAVLKYNLNLAREAKLGIWRDDETPERPVEREVEAAPPTRTQPAEPASVGPVRLTPSQLQQWALRLQVDIKIRSERLSAADTEANDGIVTTGPRPQVHDGVVPAG